MLSRINKEIFMGYNFVTNIQVCSEIVNELMNGNVNLLYYAHLPALVVSLFMGFFVFLKAKKDLVAKIFFIFSITFSFWTLFNFLAWISSDSRVIMFSWSLLGILSAIFYLLCFYFVYVFVEKSDLSFSKKFLLGILTLPIIILTPTALNLVAFEFNNCYAMDNLFFGYVYVPQIISVLWMVIFAIKSYLKSDKTTKKQIVLLMSGISFFLVTFFGGAYIADNYEMYSVEIYGLFAMMVFMGFLAYLIVRYKVFNIKLFGVQALMVSLIVLIGSQFAYVRNPTNMVLTAISLALVIVFGLFLVHSVKKEIKQKENLEKLSNELQKMNLRLQEVDRQKTEFLSIASHQLRTPMSIMKGYIELIQDGAFGKISHKLNSILKEMDESNERLVKLIDEFLDITRIEQGRTKFSYADHDFNEMVGSVVKELQGRAGGKHLKLSFTPNKQIKNVYMDDDKVRHVIFNFIDNAVKYSEKGTIHTIVEKDDDKVVVRVKDNGLGFGPEDEANFFQKFYRGNNVKGSNVTGTGLGLFVCRKFIETHGGKVWAHSAGVGKGSEFGFFIPIKNTGQI